LGYYLVGFNKFVNKTLALIESKKTKYAVKWVFNDDVYSAVDWSVPIAKSLPQLYAARAKQLREQYDYIALYYTGGADSNNILLSFLDNGLFIDEIVMQLPEPDRKNFNNTDMSNRNIYGEIDFVAVPYLNSIKHKIHPNTKLRFQDFSKSLIELLRHDNWFETNTPGTNICLGVIGRQATSLYENHILKLIDNGKRCCQLLGVDKPLVYFDGVNYYAYFTDSSAMHAAPVTLNKEEIYHKHYITEFFYWTPEMPEIVIKQAQEIKAQCEIDPNKKHLWSTSLNVHIGEFRKVMHPIIYPGLPEPVFQTEKPDSKIIRDQDLWFWNTASDEVKHNYLDVIKYLEENISKDSGIQQDIKNGLSSTNTKFYKL
jgi:hypothetical protein